MDELSRKQLSARLSDILRESERGYIGASVFLDPAEVFFAAEFIERNGKSNSAFLFGGYDGAERKCAFFLPEYYEALSPDLSSTKAILEQFCEDISGSIQMLSITGSGYKKLTHRDYLGAVLNMGIDRSAVGDICVTDDCSAVIFTTPAVSELLITSLERIGADKVKVKKLELLSSFSYERKTKDINDTVASDRLDCVVASLAAESREKAKMLILSGQVECNYSTSEKTDIRVKNGDTVTVRGIGKFIISDITEETKKGRLRLAAKKYI